VTSCERLAVSGLEEMAFQSSLEVTSHSQEAQSSNPTCTTDSGSPTNTRRAQRLHIRCSCKLSYRPPAIAKTGLNVQLHLRCA
jgi:hypothetical protein